MDPYKTSGKIHSQYVYAKNGKRFRVVEDPAEIEKIIRSHASSSSSSSPQYVYAKNGKRFRVVEDPAEIAKLSNNFVEGLQNTTDDFSFDDKDLTWGAAIRSHGMSGASAGYSDEAQALLEAGPLDYWRGNKQAEETYNRQVAKHRAYLKALAEKYPIWSNIAYGAGSLVPTALSFIPWLGILRAGSVATSAFGNLGKAALLGAGSGALHGSGAGDGLDGRLVSAGTGAGIGAVAGPVGSLFGTGASWAARKIGKGLQHIPFMKGGRFNPAYKEVQTKAVREIAKTLHDDGIENVAERLANAPRHAFLTDISPNLEVSLANMGQKNTQVSKLLQEAHDKRMRQATTRLKKSADENITPLRDTKDFKKALEEQGAREHGPLYAEAYRIPIDKKYYGDLNNLFELEVVQDALKQAAQTLKREFRYPKLEQFRSKKFPHLTYKPTMQLLDETKKALDSLSNMYDRAGNKHLANLYNLAKQDLVKVTDEIAPIYKEARASVAKYEDFAKAIDLGKKIYQRQVSGNSIREGLGKGKMPNGLNTYNVGVRDYVDSILRRNSPINKLSSTLDPEGVYKNLRRVMGLKKFSAFKKAVDSEKFYEEAAARALKPFKGTPELDNLMGVNIPHGKYSFLREGAKIIQNILSPTIRKLPQQEREILERDITKLATFGVNGMSQQEVAQMLQRFIKWHKGGIFSDKAAHFISSALAGQVGRSVRSYPYG